MKSSSKREGNYRKGSSAICRTNDSQDSCLNGMIVEEEMHTMKAVVYYGAGDIRIENIPVPDCGRDEIRVKVEACAVCGTDLKSYKFGNPRIKAPLTIGHEFSGTIETVGEEVTGYMEGERIVMATSVSCGGCYYCRNGWNNLCTNLAPMGFSYPGGMTEYVIIPSLAIKNGHVVKVPDGIEAQLAALAEPLSCAVNACENIGIKDGDVVVVIGAGPLGLMNIYVARKNGAGKIILSQRSKQRREKAKTLGCEVVVDPENEDLVSIVHEETGGLGADAVIVTAPAKEPQELALDLVRKRGTVCLFASLPSDNSLIKIDSRRIHYGEIKITGSSDSTARHVRRAIDFLRKNDFPRNILVSHVLGLEEIFRAFDLMTSRKAMRVVLRP